MPNFPEILDNFTPKVDNIIDVMAADVNGLQTAIAALQTKVGADSSAVITSHDYKIAQLEASSHAAVTVTDTAEIDMTLTGQDIKADIKTASIAKSKLDSSVQTSLGKADSAIQDISGKENVSNKKTSLADNSDTFYPTQKAVKTAVDAKQDTLAFTPEDSANKENTTIDTSTTKYPTVNLLKTVNDAIPTKATGAEVNTGTDDAKYVTPKAMEDSSYVKDAQVTRTATFVLVGSDTDLATATTIGGDFRIPGNKAITITGVGAYVDTAGTTGVTTIDINEGGTSILSTKITIDSGEKSSEDATTAPVISDSAIAANAILTFDIDGISTTAPKGLKVFIEFIYS